VKKSMFAVFSISDVWYSKKIYEQILSTYLWIENAHWYELSYKKYLVLFFFLSFFLQ